METIHIDFDEYPHIESDSITLLQHSIEVLDLTISGSIAAIVSSVPFKCTTTQVKKESESIPITEDIRARLGHFLALTQYNVAAKHIVFIAAYGTLRALDWDLIDKKGDVMYKTNQGIADSLVTLLDENAVNSSSNFINIIADEEYVEVDGVLYVSDGSCGTPHCESCKTYEYGCCFWCKEPTHFQLDGLIYKYD